MELLLLTLVVVAVVAFIGWAKYADVSDRLKRIDTELAALRSSIDVIRRDLRVHERLIRETREARPEAAGEARLAEGPATGPVPAPAPTGPARRVRRAGATATPSASAAAAASGRAPSVGAPSAAAAAAAASAAMPAPAAVAGPVLPPAPVPAPERTPAPVVRPWPSPAGAQPAAAPPSAARPLWGTLPPAEKEAGPGWAERVFRQLGLTPPAPGEAWSRSTVEAWLEGRMLAVVGGIALLLGAVFFLSLAFSRGWITEPLRVAIGLVVGGVLIVLGELAFSRLRGIVGHVLIAVGLATVSLALLAATRLYGLVPVEWGLLGALLAALAAAAIAIRHDSQLVAAFGLIAVLAAPPLLGASPTVVTLLFIATALVGTTTIALFRTWVWLPPLAFVLAAPQVASYVLGAPPVAEGLVVVVGFWLVSLVAAGGEEIRHATDRLRTSTVTLLLADAAFTVWAGFAVLGGPDTAWRGAFLAFLAVAYLALGLLFLARNGDRHPFGLVVAATGVASLTIAVPVHVGGPPVPIAWAAEAVALAWVAVLRRHPYTALTSLILGSLAIGHLVLVEYPPADLVGGAGSIPFAGPEGMTFAFLVGALVVAGLVVPVTWVRAWLAAVGALLTAYVLPFGLSGPALVAGWAALATAGFGTFARVVAPRIASDFREERTPVLRLPVRIAGPVAVAVAVASRAARPAYLAIAGIAGLCMLGQIVLVEYPVGSIVAGAPHEVPFVGSPGLSYAIVLAAIVATWLLVTVRWARIALTALGGLVTLYVLPFETSGALLVAAWSALAVAGFVVEARILVPRVGPLDGPRPHAYTEMLARPSVVAVAALALGSAIAHLLAVDFPPDQVLGPTLSSPPYAGPEGLALAAVLAAIGLVGWVMRARWIRLGLIGVGAALLAYTATFEIPVPGVAAAWGIVALASLWVVRRLTVIPVAAKDLGRPWEVVSERLPYAAAGLAVLFQVVGSLRLADPVGLSGHVMGRLDLTGTPFVDERTAMIVALAATLVLAGLIWRGTIAAATGAVGAGIALAWLVPFEVRPGYAVAGWCLIALGGLALARAVPASRLLAGAASLVLVGLAALVTLAVVAPPSRLIVSEMTSVLGWPLLTDASVALAALAVVAIAGGLLHRHERLALPALAVGGAAAVYLLSVAVADQFQLQVGTRPLEELQKSAQVGLTVLWSILGAAGFAIGLVTHRPEVRIFGLVLLGIATVKVFLVDLAALDVAYRVLSLVALGVVLLVSAAMYSRMQHPHGPTAPQHP
jgi:hypothetical protein